MPDTPYTNPKDTPPVAPYTWEPPFPPAGREVAAIGWDTTTIVRGKFRNDYPATTLQTTGSVATTSHGATSGEGSSDWPFLVPFRPLARPGVVHGAPPPSPFVASGKDLFWQAKFTSNGPMSAMTLRYALTVDYNDPSILPLLTAADSAEVQAATSDPNHGPPNVDWTQYSFGKLLGGGDPLVERPVLDAKKHPQALFLTGVQGVGGDPVLTATIKFGAGRFPSGYPTLSTLRIENRFALPSLRLTLYSVMLFDALAVNLTEKQVPCALLQYAFNVAFQFDPTRGQLTWPTTGTTPNFHVKVFHPDSPTGSAGFAHSVNLRFLIYAQPEYGLNPADLTSLVGLLTDINNPSIYRTIFIGPVNGARSIALAMSPKAVTALPGRVILTDSVSTATATIILQKAVGGAGAAPPSANADWQPLGEYTLASPPTFSDDGPWLSPFLYLDKAAKALDWYRLVQQFASGFQRVGGPYQSEPYTEKSVLTMADSASLTSDTATLVRRVRLVTADPGSDPLHAPPLAVFVSQDGDPLAAPVRFDPGPWTLRLLAHTSDALHLTDSHLIARFWFQPDNDALSPSDPHKYRDQTEFYFQSDSSGSRMVRGTPTSLDQVMVSPPLTAIPTRMEITRYMDSLAGKDTQYWSPPFGSGVRVRLVVGLYEASYATDFGRRLAVSASGLGLPYASVQIDGQDMTLTTTVEQVLSGRIFPERVTRYSSSQYAPLPKPLALTRTLVGGQSLDADPSLYRLYSGMFASRTSAAATSPFLGLVTLQPTAPAPLKLCLPFSAIAVAEDASAAVYADFCTDGPSLASGKIGAGPWTFTIALNNSVDTARVGCDLLLAAFLVTTDGTVRERVFTSPLLKDSGASGPTRTVHCTVNIDLPFEIGGQDTQLVVRLGAYPFSRDGSVVDVSALGAQMAKLGLPLGARIDALTLTTHTLSSLQINQVASFAASPAFYEDLPLVPPRSFGTQEFIFVADPAILPIQYTFPDIPFNISGALYSKPWFCSLPEGIEVDFREAGIGPTKLLFRTVPSKGSTANSQLSTSAVEDPLSGRIHVATEENSAGVSAQSVGPVSALADEGFVVRHYCLDNPLGRPAENSLVRGTNASANANLLARYPSLALIHGAPSSGHRSTIGLIGQVDEQQYSSTTCAINISHGAPGTWRGPNRDMGDNAFGQMRRLSQGLSYPTLVSSDRTHTAYVAGWCQPGAILVRETSLWDAGRDGTLAEGSLYLVDTDSSVLLADIQVGGGQDITRSAGSHNGHAVETFPGILVDDTGCVTVAYVLEGRDGQLLARDSQGGKGFGAAYVAASLRVQSGGGSASLAILGPALAWHASSRSAYAAFWCGGKIMVTALSRLITGSGAMLSPVQLVAGGRDLTDSSNPANAALRALQGAGNLRVEQGGEPEQDVPSQRPGLFVSDQWPYQGHLVVTYHDGQNNVCLRIARIGGNTTAPNVLNRA